MSKIKLVLDVVQDLRRLTDSIEALCDAIETGSEPNAPTPVEPVAPAAESVEPETSDAKVSLVELRAFVAEKSTPEKRPLIKALLNKYGVKKLTELAEDQYAPLLKEVAAL